MFLYNPFVLKNTQRLRYCLLMRIKRDAPIIGNMFGDALVAGCCCCYGTSRYHYYKERKDRVDEYNIDCGTDGDLFLAIAALRNDSDKEQWFYSSERNEWILSKQHKFELSGYHKASKDELIEHFNELRKIKRYGKKKS